MVGLPEDDRNPYRHRYGDYTHQSANGRYSFEWTPFTPAIEAWKNAENRMRLALDDLTVAQRSEGFALNGLAQYHTKMIGSLAEFARDLQASAEQAAVVIAVLEIAHRDYAAANEASLAEYQSLMAMIDGVTRGHADRQHGLDAEEKARDDQAARDLDEAMTGEEQPEVLAPGPFVPPGGKPPGSGSGGSGGGIV